MGLRLAFAGRRACGSNPKVQKAPAAPVAEPSPVAPVPAPAPAPDPIAALIQTSQDHFAAGERELKLGHLERARTEFDRAVDVLLESPYGARTDARMREHFDRLIDRINAHEVTALAQGDGFSETKYRAGLDRRDPDDRHLPEPDADAATEEAVKADLAATEHDVPIPQNAKVLASVELFQGRLRDYVQESLTRGVEVPADDPERLPRRGLPLDLAYIPVIESGFKTNALSKASAKGPWQFMKPTARITG